MSNKLLRAMLRHAGISPWTKAIVTPQSRVGFFISGPRYAEERERLEEINSLGGATTGNKVDLVVRGDP
jgi:hypothetical protein